MRFSRYKIGIINSKDSYWIKWAFPPHLTFVNDSEKHFLNPMGLSGLEPPTSRLSGVRSNQLSYKPFYNLASTCSPTPSPVQYHRPLRS